MKKEYDIIDKFFKYREEDVLDAIEEDRKYLKEKMNGIKREDIEKILDLIPKESVGIKREIENCIDNLIADYNIMLAYYNKKYYKIGFDDAICLNKICKEQ